MLYGPGGIGKSTLASLAPKPVFVDINRGTSRLQVERIEDVTDWDALRRVVQDRAFLAGYQTIVIDSGTEAEELALAWTLANVPHEKGGHVARIEDYGFGKGYQHLFDTWMQILADLDRAVETGTNVVLICHECVADVPNPYGADFIRYEPRLQAPKSGRASIRSRTFEWADHVFYLGYDVLSQDGKGRGSGTRTIYAQQLPTHVAKSRAGFRARAWNDQKDASAWKEVF
jgi:hypothetical protein